MDRKHSDRVLLEWDRLTRTTPRPVVSRQRDWTTKVAAIAVAGTVAVAIALLTTNLLADLRQDGTRTGAEPLPTTSTAWGPLAVVPASRASAEARTMGTLHITESCVLLMEPDGAASLLIWPSNRTAWLPGEEAIQFTNLDRTTVTVRDGDRVILSGGGASIAEGGISGEEFVTKTDWVATPRPTCPADVRWKVGDSVEIADAE